MDGNRSCPPVWVPIWSLPISSSARFPCPALPLESRVEKIPVPCLRVQPLGAPGSMSTAPATSSGRGFPPTGSRRAYYHASSSSPSTRTNINISRRVMRMLHRRGLLSLTSWGTSCCWVWNSVRGLTYRCQSSSPYLRSTLPEPLQPRLPCHQSPHPQRIRDHDIHKTKHQTPTKNKTVVRPRIALVQIRA